MKWENGEKEREEEEKKEGGFAGQTLSSLSSGTKAGRQGDVNISLLL